MEGGLAAKYRVRYWGGENAGYAHPSILVYAMFGCTTVTFLLSAPSYNTYCVCIILKLLVAKLHCTMGVFFRCTRVKIMNVT